MAFFAMILAYTVIFTVIVLSTMFSVGIVLLIVGNIQKRRPKYADRKFPKVLITVGTVFIVIPLSIGGYVAVGFLRTNHAKSPDTAYENSIDESKIENYAYTHFLK